MKILATQPCQACAGQGQQLHPSWDEYHSVREVFTTAEFFGKLGYLPTEPPPPLLIPCRACRGRMEVEAWLPLEMLLPDLMRLFREQRKVRKAA